MAIFRRVFFALGIAWFAVGPARADSLDQWTLRPSGTGSSLISVAHGAGKFVAVGATIGTPAPMGLILVSTNNGTDWNIVSTPTITNGLQGVAWGQNQFVVAGDKGIIFTSPDAVTWTQQISPVTNNLRTLRFVGDQFMAVGVAGKLIASTNGINWEARNPGAGSNLEGVAFGNGIFCAVGPSLAAGPIIIRSLDGITWTNQNPQFLNLYEVTFANGLFVAEGANGQIYTSTNALNWVLRQSGDAGWLVDATFAQGHFVAVGAGTGTNAQKIVSSSDGINWKRRPVFTQHSGNLIGVAYGNGYFVAVGAKGIVLQSAPVFTLSDGNFLPSGEMHWTLTGETGRSYRFQFLENLGTTNWSDLTNFVSMAETTLLNDPTPNLPIKFYRVVSP